MQNSSMLALDLATTTGFAVASADYVNQWVQHEQIMGSQDRHSGLISGSKLFNDLGTSRGAVFCSFLDWLDDMNQVHGFDKICYEAPIPFMSNLYATRILIGLTGLLEAYCCRKSIPIYSYKVSNIKMYATGKGNAKKEHMIEEAVNRGWFVCDDNEADALWLMDLHLHQMNERDKERQLRNV